jgi:glycosyltransferase involved in cell wall biosynthesis
MTHRILYVQAVGERGGVETVLLNMVVGLDRARFEPIVAGLRDGSFLNELRRAGVDVRLLPAGRVRQLYRGGRTVTALARLIRGTNVHLVHSHNAVAHLYGGLAARIAGVPSIFHLHGVPPPGFNRDGVIGWLAAHVRASKILAVSQYVADDFQHVWGRRDNVEVLHNGIQAQTLLTEAESASVRAEFSVSPQTPIVVMATRLQRWKGVHVFLDAVARVQADFPQAHFFVVGGGLFGLEQEYERALHESADRQRPSRLTFTGFRPDVYRFMREADLVVHASIAPDPFPTVILEAMAFGKPVIATRLGGCPESVVDEVTGLLVAPGDASALSGAMARLLADPLLRQQMGRRAQQRFEELFTLPRMMERLQQVYHTLLATPARLSS